MDQQETNKQKS